MYDYLKGRKKRIWKMRQDSFQKQFSFKTDQDKIAESFRQVGLDLSNAMAMIEGCISKTAREKYKRI